MALARIEPTPQEWLNGLRHMTYQEYLAFVQTLPAPRKEDLAAGRLGPGRNEFKFLQPLVASTWNVINERAKAVVIGIQKPWLDLDYNNGIIVGEPEDILAGVSKLLQVLETPMATFYVVRVMR